MPLTGGSNWSGSSVAPSTTTMNGPRPVTPYPSSSEMLGPVPVDQIMQDSWTQAANQAGFDPSQYAGAAQSIFGQLMMALSQGGMNANQLQSQYGFDAARLGLDAQGNALDQQGIASQLGFLGQREGLSREQLANQLAGLGINKESAKLNAATDIRNNDSAAVAAGAIFSPMSRMRNEDTRASLDQQLRGIGLQEQGARLDQRGNQIGFDEQRDQLGRQGSQLDIMAQNLGISSAELQANLQHALQNNDLGMLQQIFSAQQAGTQMLNQQGMDMTQIAILAQQLAGGTMGQLQAGGVGNTVPSAAPYMNTIPSSVQWNTNGPFQ